MLKRKSIIILSQPSKREQLRQKLGRCKTPPTANWRKCMFQVQELNARLLDGLTPKSSNNVQVEISRVKMSGLSE